MNADYSSRPNFIKTQMEDNVTAEWTVGENCKNINILRIEGFRYISITNMDDTYFEIPYSRLIIAKYEDVR